MRVLRAEGEAVAMGLSTLLETTINLHIGTLEDFGIAKRGLGGLRLRRIWWLGSVDTATALLWALRDCRRPLDTGIA